MFSFREQRMSLRCRKTFKDIKGTVSENWQSFVSVFRQSALLPGVGAAAGAGGGGGAAHRDVARSTSGARGDAVQRRAVAPDDARCRQRGEYAQVKACHSFLQQHMFHFGERCCIIGRQSRSFRTCFQFLVSEKVENLLGFTFCRHRLKVWRCCC